MVELSIGDSSQSQLDRVETQPRGQVRKMIENEELLVEALNKPIHELLIMPPGIYDALRNLHIAWYVFALAAQPEERLREVGLDIDAIDLVKRQMSKHGLSFNMPLAQDMLKGHIAMLVGCAG